MKELGVKLLTKTAKLPTRSYEKSLAYDFYVDSVEEIPDNFGEIIKVHTGVALQFPDGWGGIFFDRSGLALEGYFVVAGVIDEDYRGEITLILHKDKALMNPERGVKIAQMILIPTPKFQVVEYASIDKTERGKKGFGSTGDK